MPNLLRRRTTKAGRSVREAVHAEQVRLLYRQLPLALGSSLVTALIVAAVLWEVVETRLILLWLLVFTLVSLARAVTLWLFRRSDEERRDYRRWERVHILGAGLAGLVTGAVGLFPGMAGHLTQLSFLAAVFAGMSAGALSTNSSSLPAALAYVLSLMLPTGLGLLPRGVGLELALGGLIIVFAVLVSLTAMRYNKTLSDALRLRFRNNALYREMVRANERVRVSAGDLQAEMDQRERAERNLAAYAKRLQRTNEALQREVADRERNEQLLTQQALSILESEVQMRAVFQNAFDAILTFSGEGAIATGNRAAQSLFGYPEAELEGRDIRELIPGLQRIAATHQVVEEEGRRSDGERFPLAFSVDEMQVGRQLQYVCILRDETQAQLAKEALIKAKEAAEAANRAKSEFLSSMSHELRTPLNAILGFTQLLQTDPTDPMTEGQTESVDQIASAGWHLLQLINDVLDLAKIESGRMETVLEEVALGELILETMSLILPNAEQHGITLEDRSEGTELVLRADYMRLKQVLLNLLSNAVKYNRPGGSVTIEAPEVRGGRCRLTVADTGKGLTADQIDRIFAPFVRVAENKEEIEGTGIGLTITRKLLEMMDGVIGVESEPERGSRFWIELPLAGVAETPKPEETVVAERQEEAAAPADLGCRLLYVEDNPANLKLVQSVLRQRRPNIELLSAEDGPKGLELARAGNPDLILLDISLPGMSGFDLLHALKENPRTDSIPAVALSANAMPRDIEMGLAAGFDKYLTKPIDVALLLGTLDELLAGGREKGG